MESDTFNFSISLGDRPCTRRGILSTISSICDPLGFVAPVLLEGRTILQELCRNNTGLDDPVPNDIQSKWFRWKSELEDLQSFAIPRCYKPINFGRHVVAENHHFSDASFKIYGQRSYLGLVNENGKICFSFVLGKARVTPLKTVTLPRLDLTAAVLSARVSEQLKGELDIEITGEVSWTDSRVVLGYIANSVRRFHVFVANRVQEIQDKTLIKQWRYVDTKTNPADEASRGLRARELAQSNWIQGPDFLCKPETEWDATLKQPVRDAKLLDDDIEVKKIMSLATAVTPSLTYFSDWQRANKAITICHRYVRLLRSKIQKGNEDKITRKLRSGKRVQPISIQELYEAEVVILKAVQQEFDPNTSPSSSLGKLDPYMDSNGVIRIGGRLNLSDVSGQCIHPEILPKTGHVTEIIIRHYHHKVRHQGGATSAVSSVIRAVNYEVNYRSNVWLNYRMINWKQRPQSPITQLIILAPS